MPAIHQFVAGFTRDDAISHEALLMQGVFRSWGFDSDIFSERKRIAPESRKHTRDLAESGDAFKPEDVVLLHLSIGSPANETFAALPCRKAILYHNITPSHYFNVVNTRTAHNLAEGRRQLEALAGVADVTMADSQFNASELVECGYEDVKVLPLMLDLSRLRSTPDRRILKRLNDGKTNILFVGRCVPNKKLEDLLRACAYFHRCVNPNARLVHVGSLAGTERYYYLLRGLARELGLNDAIFADAVPQAELNAYYRCADLFLCMSEHEGFCIPVMEGMLHDVPVLAFAAAAVPETMDGAGVLFHKKDFGPIAEMMGCLTSDTNLRRAVIAGQRERLARYEARDLTSELRGHLAPLLDKLEPAGRPAPGTA